MLSELDQAERTGKNALSRVLNGSAISDLEPMESIQT
jgi:hypothetical protein